MSISRYIDDVIVLEVVGICVIGYSAVRRPDINAQDQQEVSVLGGAAQWVLDRGMDNNIRDKSNVTSLLCTVRNGYINIVNRESTGVE